ncbi:MAG: hypothetical protein PHO62_09230 [Sulfurimonas sp.]|uniref:hypothetical protein n=1 Tax=Sulfurimonas sp. TaxID=2022749 RepID=UPI00261C7EF7|nr:hypothetical protein [Sulfurimonas sp.]MDD5373591.1 hypothetical protein [Sulfurimonas sp.]
MNDTEKEFKNPNVALESKIKNLVKVLDGLNAHGSLDLDDYMIITDYLKGAFPEIKALKEV